MSTGGDDIERLLREVEALDGSGSGQVAKRGPDQVAKPAKGKDVEKEESGSKSGRLAFAVVAAVAVGVLGALAGMFLGPVLGWLPLLDFGFWATGLGAAFGGFITALVAGPPRWFSD